MKPAHLHILQHALGVDEYGQGQQYRNHFVTGIESSDYPLCCELVELGLMQNRGGSPLVADDDLFMVTDAGRKAMMEASPKPPYLSRSQRRYREWLHAELNLSFGEWLKTLKYRNLA